MDTVQLTARRRKVYKYLSKTVSGINPGDRLPSVRTMAAECGASPPTILSVLDMFRDEGVVRVTPGQGIYRQSRAGRPLENVRQVDVIYFGNNKAQDAGTFHGSLNEHLARLLGEQMVSIRLHCVPFHAQPEELRPILARVDCQACMLINCTLDGLDGLLGDSHVSWVHLFPSSTYMPDCCVYIDNTALVEKQVGYLMDLGHRAIGYIHVIEPDAWHRDHTERRENFYRLVAERQLIFQPNWVQFGGYESATVNKAVQRMFAGKDRPTAMICSDYHLIGVYHALGKLNLAPGRDVSVLGTDDLPASSSVTPPASSTMVRRDEAARLAIELLEARHAGLDTDSYRRAVPVEIDVRESTSRISAWNETTVPAEENVKS